MIRLTQSFKICEKTGKRNESNMLDRSSWCDTIKDIVDSLEKIDEDDLAAIAEAQTECANMAKNMSLNSVGILVEPDPPYGIDSEPLDSAVNDVASMFGDTPVGFKEIANSDDVIMDLSNSQIESIIESLKDMF